MGAPPVESAYLVGLDRPLTSEKPYLLPEPPAPPAEPDEPAEPEEPDAPDEEPEDGPLLVCAVTPEASCVAEVSSVEKRTEAWR